MAREPTTISSGLAGLALSGYRSYGHQDLQYLAPLGPVNVLAGPNGSGKSHAMRFLAAALTALRDGGPMSLGRHDGPTRDGQPVSAPVRVSLGVSVTPGSAARAGLIDDDVPFEVLEKIFARPSFAGPSSAGAPADGRIVWFEFEAGEEGWAPPQRQLDDLREALSDSDLLGELAVRYCRGRGPRNAELVLEHLAVATGARTFPAPMYIPALRRIAPSADRLPDRPLWMHDPGESLADLLREAKNPGRDDAALSDRFAEIERLIQDVLGDPAVRIETPSREGGILVTHRGQRVGFAEHGTAIEQLLMLATAARLNDGRLVLIEEPEAHLHPTLQRRLLTYLGENTTNQYILATHSPHLLDHGTATITSVRKQEGWSRTHHAADPAAVHDLAWTLGIRASDLVQANAVVWVEGPSDRIYLRHWIACLDPQLIDGVHYSVMFYGGSLLKHLSASDSAAPLVSLPRLNRNFALVVDSDRTAAGQKLDAAKQALLRSFGGAGAPLVWVTQGYTIENYLDLDVLTAARSDLPGRRPLGWDGELLTPPLPRAELRGQRFTKVTLAEAFVRRAGDDPGWRSDGTDVERRTRAIVAMIRRANDLEG